MRNVLILIYLIAALPAVAESSDPAEELNVAWRAYTAALEQQDHQLVVTTAKAALDAGEKVLEPSDERMLALHINYARSLNDAGDTDAASDAYKVTLDLTEDIHGKRSLESLTLLPEYADTLASAGSAGRQLNVYRRALKIVERESGENSLAYAKLAQHAAIRAYDLSRSTDGRRLLLSARDIYQQSKGEDSLEVAFANFYLGKFEYTNRRYRKSADYLTQALPGFAGEDDQHIEYRMHAHALLVQVYERRNMSDEATEHCVAIGELSPLRAAADYKPLFRAVPRYPYALLTAGAEGHVDFEFTVDEHGFVRDPTIINRASTGEANRSSSIHRMEDEDVSFDAAALKAVERFRYAPRVVDGKAVAVEGVKTRISFAIED